MGIRNLSGVSLYLLSLMLFGLFAWYCVHDPVACTVHGAGIAAANGYYAATDGIYLHRGENGLSHVPNFFEVLEQTREITRPASIIKFQGVEWDMLVSGAGRIAYASRPERPAENVLRPPAAGWAGKEPGLGPTPPSEVSCRGDLPNSPNGQLSPTDNMEKLTRRPVTTLLLLVNLLVGYYLWSRGVEVSAVSFSYDAVCNSGEAWRVVTASFSHFDAMHIGFNLMSLYQLGDLEFVYGSAAFLYLNIDLVFITMIICLAICSIRMKYFGHVEIQHQQSIGFSCVLFAWMVAASVRMDQYCPLFFMPSMCFDTWHLAVPLLSLSLPVNLGPFVLLVVTKLVLPRTSLVGHFSGIVIGFPLAWNLIDWLTPAILCLCLSLCLCASRNLWPWTLPGYATSDTEVLSTTFSADEIFLHNRINIVANVFAFFSAVGVYIDGPLVLAPVIRLFIAVTGVYVYHVVRCLWLAELRASKQDSLILIACVVTCLSVLVICDVMSVVACWEAKGLLLYSCGLSAAALLQGQCLYLIYLVVELYFLFLILRVLHVTPEAKYYLRLLQMDDTAVSRDADGVARTVQALPGGYICVPREEEVESFQGQGHRLVTSDDPEENRASRSIEL